MQEKTDASVERLCPDICNSSDFEAYCTMAGEMDFLGVLCLKRMGFPPAYCVALSGVSGGSWRVIFKW